ncbi:MAG: adenylate/guanylate cyclase domain-containing protein [Deltaproteobacteria bacterium]|nr:adenylate/guanylate cyclase domain-containing protein [Deltaproteobacteria bacterium]
MIRSLPFFLSLAVMIGAIVVVIVEPPFVVGLRNASFDTFQRWRTRAYQQAPVRIVDIDEKSLKKYGQWPWPRSRMAALVDKLRAFKSAAIVLDMVLAEPDRTSPAALARYWPDDPGITDMVKRLPDPDRLFASAVARGSVVTGFSVGSETSSGRRPALKTRFIIAGDDPRQFLPPFKGAVTTLSPFEAVADGNGAFNFIPDHDGVIRHVPLLLRIHNDLYPSLAAEALRVAQGARNFVVKSSGSSGEGRFGGHTGIVRVRIGALPIETDPRGEIWLHFSESLPERYVPAWKIFEGDVDPELLTGHIVIVGTSAKGLQDLRFSPLGRIIPGVEVQAQLVEQLIQKTYLARPDWATAAMILYLMVMWGALVTMASRVSILWSAAIGIAIVGMTFLATWYAFIEARLSFDPFFPSLAFGVMFLAWSIPRHLLTERERRWIRKAFSAYVSPNLVKHLIDHPEQLELGGEKRECSFVHTDLADFTTLMEKSNPSELVALLNTYLDEMIQIAFRHDGTLERIVGDAVCVTFSAPVRQSDHAARAVACALEMDTFARGFALARQAEGIEFGMTRIGVHSGVVLVGNFGGKSMLDYRALGDPINTAARLESANKQFGTLVFISRATAEKCPGFIGRPVGTLVLKGKSQGIEVFEPLSAEAAETPATASYMEAFRLLEQGDPRARDAFTALAKTSHDDPLVRFHLNRLNRGETGVTVILSVK